MDNADAALEFIHRLQHRCSELCAMPNRGRKRDDLTIGLRSSRVGNHLIFYRTKGDKLEVIHVLHDRRDLPKMFK
jgi:toxin ParE1/3/4